MKQIKELQVKDALSQQILQALSSKTKVSEILEMLNNGDSPEVIARSLDKFVPPGKTSSDSTSPAMSFAEVDQSAKSPDSASSIWTTVTNDQSVLDHLFQLYFAWVHPVHTFFSEGHFVHSYHKGSSESDGYCSSLLVNALCAMACHLHLALDSDTVDFRELGVEFADAVREEMIADDFRLTTIQAYAAMFLVEITRGNALLAQSYLDIAANSLSRVDSRVRKSSGNVWKCTVWGIQELNVQVALTQLKLPC